MTLSSLITTHASSVFLNTSHFAETVTVFGLPGGNRTVTANVVREAARREEGQVHETRPWECTVDFIDDATNGAAATGVGYHEIRDLEADGKRFSIRLAEDDPQERWDFVEVAGDDAGGMVTCRFERRRIVSRGMRPRDL